MRDPTHLLADIYSREWDVAHIILFNLFHCWTCTGRSAIDVLSHFSCSEPVDKEATVGLRGTDAQAHQQIWIDARKGLPCVDRSVSYEFRGVAARDKNVPWLKPVMGVIVNRLARPLHFVWVVAKPEDSSKFEHGDTIWIVIAFW